MGDLPLAVQKTVGIDFSDDLVFRWSFPDSFGSWFGDTDHKAARDVMLTGDFLIFLHEWNVKFGVFVDLDSELRVVKPSVVAFELQVFWEFAGFVFGLQHEILGLGDLMLFEMGFFCCVDESFVIELVEIGGAAAAVGFAKPFAFDWVDFPVFGEDFVDGNSVELEHKIA